MKKLVRYTTVFLLPLVGFTTLAGGLEKQLLNAVEAGDLAKVETLLEKGANPNFAKDGDTVLMCATEFGDLRMVSTLFEKGAKKSQVAKNGNPVTKAAMLGRINALKYFLEKGFPIDVEDAQNRTPLIHAALNGETQMASLLLEAGADPNHRDKNKDTPLLIAVKKGWVEIASQLLNQGADSTVKDHTKNTPLAFIYFLRNRDLLRLFQARGLVEIPGGGADFTDLMPERVHTPWTAASDGDIDTLKKLGKDQIDIKNNRNATPLMEAIWSRRIEAARYLLSQGADPNVSDKHGNTPASLAKVNQDQAMLRMLIKAGANSPTKEEMEQQYIPSDFNNLTLYLSKYPGGRTSRSPETAGSEGVSQEIEAPVLTKRVSPKYPEKAIKSKINGFVILDAIFGKDGMVYDISVVQNLGDWRYGFESNAISALKMWEFTPGKIDGKPAEIRLTLKLEFFLKPYPGR